MFQELNSKALAGVTAPVPHAKPPPEARDLVRRYPNLSEIELARLINLYRQFSALDMALMMSDQGLAPRLDRFMEDHRRKLRTPFRHYAFFIVYGFIAIAAIAWATIRTV